jgi:hypothetical protein
LLDLGRLGTAFVNFFDDINIWSGARRDVSPNTPKMLYNPNSEFGGQEGLVDFDLQGFTVGTRHICGLGFVDLHLTLQQFRAP